jgi:predicted nucleic acid-binding protein
MNSVAMNKAIEAASKIYLDANCIIYFVERADELQAKIAQLIRHAGDHEQGLACSEVGVAECLYGAFKMGNHVLEETYEDIFYNIALFELCPLDGQRAKQAARLGAEKSLKLIDATHFLAAIEFQCDVFVTNDARIRSSHGIQVIQLKDL